MAEKTTAVRGTISIVLRYDDYGGAVPCQADQQVIAAALRYNVRFTFGVIPVWDGQPPGAASVQTLLPALKKGVIELAQHGYTHEALWRWRGRSSEFTQMPFADQLQRIAAGKKSLEKAFGQQVSSFIPPWNRYDDATVACLEKLGFNTLSADNRFPGWDGSRLKGMPVTCELRELQGILNSTRATGLKNALIVCLFHCYDFREMDSNRGWLSFEEFKAIMNWLTTQPEVETLTITEASQRFAGITGPHQRTVCRWQTCENLLPTGWRVPMPGQFVYPDLDRVRHLIRLAALKLGVFNFVVFSGAAGIAFGFSRWIHDHFSYLQTSGDVASLAALLLAAMYAFRDRAFNLRRMVAFAIASGAVFGWFGANVFRHGP